MRYGLSGASVVTFGNNIFISGGVGAGGILKAVRRILVFDHKANLWYMGPPMKEVSKLIIFQKYKRFMLDEMINQNSFNICHIYEIPKSKTQIQNKKS